MFKKQIDNLKTNRHRVRPASLTHPLLCGLVSFEWEEQPAAVATNGPVNGVWVVYMMRCVRVRAAASLAQEIFVLQDNRFRWLRHVAGPSDDTSKAAELASTYLAYPCGMIKGAPALGCVRRLPRMATQPPPRRRCALAHESAARVTLNHGRRCVLRRAGEFRGAVRGVRRGGGYHRGGLCVPPLSRRPGTSPLGSAALSRARAQSRQEARVRVCACMCVYVLSKHREVSQVRFTSESVAQRQGSAAAATSCSGGTANCKGCDYCE